MRSTRREQPVTMLLLTLILHACSLRARGEWVQISQHHIRPHHNERYNNQSLTHHWDTYRKQDIKLIPDIKRPDFAISDIKRPDFAMSDIKRPDFAMSDIKRPDFAMSDIKRPDFAISDIKRPDFAISDIKRPDFAISDIKRPDFAIPDIKRPDFTTGKIERVPNIGNVKRVQITNTPVKSPTAKRPQHGDEINLHSDIFEDNYEVVAVTPKYRPSGNVEKVTDFVENIVRPYDKKQQTQIKRKENNTKEVIATNSDKQTSDVKVSVVEEILNKVKPQFVTRNDKIFIPDTEDNINVPNKNSEDDKHPNIHKTNGANNVETVIKVDADEVKVNTMDNILKLMKVVTDTISSNTRRGVNGKVKYLNDLKDVMLASIKERIDATWPDDSVPRRVSRSADARGHVEFPSSESALMTISFLTFAVFLIKLVLQVIQTYKHKAMIMAPVVVATAGRNYARKRMKN